MALSLLINRFVLNGPLFHMLRWKVRFILHVFFSYVVLESLIDSSDLVRPKRPALSYVVLEILNHSRESGHAMIHAN